MTTPSEAISAISEYAKTRDLYLFSGVIDPASADKFVDLVQIKDIKRVSVFLTTSGGDPDGAYRMIRRLQGYDDIRILVAGKCKSAGTLIAVGANSLAYGPWGELGPLDTQMTKPDEILSASSGLDVLQALTIITEHGFDSFRQYLIEFVANGISTKVAAEIAAGLASRLFEPIAAQVDPMRLAEAERAIKIATQYGQRLGERNLKPNALRSLVHDYPTHGFVIDKKEAALLFEVVEDLSQPEGIIAKYLEDSRRIVRYPSQRAVALDLVSEYTSQDESKEEGYVGDQRNPEEAFQGEPGDTGGDEAKSGAPAGVLETRTDGREAGTKVN